MWYSNRGKALFRDISFTNTDTLVPSLYQTERSLLSVVSATSAPPFQTLRYQRNVCHPFVNRFTRHTSHRKQETFIYEYPLHWVLLLTRKNARQKAVLRWCIPQTRSPFWLPKLCSEHAHVRQVLRLSWSCAVLLPGDTHRTSITSITAVLLAFVIYLLTLPRTCKSGEFSSLATRMAPDR
jgi:hypothetical protein